MSALGGRGRTPRSPNTEGRHHHLDVHLDERPQRVAYGRGWRAPGACPGPCSSCPGSRPEPAKASSTAVATNGDFERSADLPHPVVAQPTETLHERPDRHGLDRVEVHDGGAWYRVLARLERNLGREPPDRRRTRPDQCAAQAGNRNVPRQHYDRPATGLRELTPPELTSARKRVHDAPAAARNEARSPHSSRSSRGCVSYAAYAASISAPRSRARRAASASSMSTESGSPERERRALASNVSSTVVLTLMRAIADHRSTDMPQMCHGCATRIGGAGLGLGP